MVTQSFSIELSGLHAKLNDLLRQKDDLEVRLREQYGKNRSRHSTLAPSGSTLQIAAPSLSLRTVPSHGLHIHIAKAKRHSSIIEESADAKLVDRSATTRCYFHQVYSTASVPSDLADICFRNALGLDMQ